ncbi:hypothetical protein DFQ27_000074 [Actinomortierella ambigua]|uniref:Protein kinase domain-containing protein n=1 Tax=Actinomortierella ambigua TaxID=1343610 RepID=A0A9P6QNW6_9FUNG|nr:hypothetical protein DFQ27_000074 [Actinomortierella ambigua]
MPINIASGSCPSPPPSPSRNSIFDQSWLVEAGPNIASAYPKKSQSSVYVPLPLSPSPAPRHATKVPPSKAQQPTMTFSPVSGSSSLFYGSLDTRGASSDLPGHPVVSSSLSTTATSTATTTSSSSSSTSSLSSPSVDLERIEGANSHKHWKPSDTWTTAAAVGASLPTTTTTSSTTSDLIRRPSSTYYPSMPALSLKLVKSKSSFLGNGRHSEVYKASAHRLYAVSEMGESSTSFSSPKNLGAEHVHVSTADSSSRSTTPSIPSSSTMTSLAPRTLLGLAPLSLSPQLHHPQEPLKFEPLSQLQQRDNSDSASWTAKGPEQRCAVKCLFPDDESQQVGWTEALLLQSLQTNESSHPGRDHVVGLLGVYDQATQSGFTADDQESFDFHQARLDRISQSSSPRSQLQASTATPVTDTEPEWALLLEYCSQGSLWDWVQRHPEQVGLQLWLSWAIQLAQAVDFVHSEQLVHHDIKPHNIMLTSMLDAKLSDFGAARKVEDSSIGLTDGLGRGTPPYSAPEIFHMNKSYSYPIDIYSLGVTLYVAGLTAQEPFSKLKSVVEMMVWVKKGGFWQWEEQGWIHDRGPVPKKTSQSQASVSSAAAAAAAAAAHHAQQLEARSGGPYTQGRLWGSLSNSSLSSISSISDFQHAPSKEGQHPHRPLPPLNTHGLSVMAQQPTPGPLTSPMVASFPNSPLDPTHPSLWTSSSAHLAAPSITMTSTMSPPTYQQEMNAAVSPPSSCPSSPLPQPMLSATATRKDQHYQQHSFHYPPYHHHSLPRSRPPSQQSLVDLASSTLAPNNSNNNGTVWRFLNGEPVDGAIIGLLKAMCHPNPQQRPTAGQVVAQLEEIQDRLGVLAMPC